MYRPTDLEGYVDILSDIYSSNIIKLNNSRDFYLLKLVIYLRNRFWLTGDYYKLAQPHYCQIPYISALLIFVEINNWIIVYFHVKMKSAIVPIFLLIFRSRHLFHLM